MPVTLTLSVELDGRDNGWTDVTADVLSPLSLSYGITGSGPNDRTASTGTCAFALDNSASNSAQTLGYYSPSGPFVRSGFQLGARVRVQFTDPATTTTHTRFIGSIVSITPDPGIYGPRRVQVSATDWIDEAARATVNGLTTQINKRSDEIISTLIGNVPRQPEAQSLGTGRSTFAYSLDTARDDRSNPVLQELARVTASELGYFYVTGDGTATFEPRYSRLSTTDDVTLDNDMAGLSVTTSRDELLTRVQVVTHPRTVDTSVQVLYRLASPTQIPVGQTVTLLGGYTDPNNRASRVGGFDMLTPVATTDYTANAASDGSGANLTSAISVTSELSGNGVRFEVTNTGTQAAYLTKLQARGKGIYDYEQTVAEASDATLALDVGEQVANLDMPYQGDAVVASDAAGYLLQLYGATAYGTWTLGTAGASELDSARLAFRTHSAVGSVRLAPKTAALQTAMLAWDIGDRVAIRETVTGLSKSFYIQSVTLECQAPGVLFCTWGLTPADMATYWRLGDTGVSELDETARLAYS